MSRARCFFRTAERLFCLALYWSSRLRDHGWPEWGTEQDGTAGRSRPRHITTPSEHAETTGTTNLYVTLGLRYIVTLSVDKCPIALLISVRNQRSKKAASLLSL